ncbi:hypothetical protein MLD38_003808 [Melastoma candidum]|uniref:Uncharacterized protein n=1 Tax=Melastoma candidum TaxID=119954 RepID=A0ACB9S374_9MYRT|nr:hypothetical protein MLD38_003808 [Melastoma candidum]
MGLTTGARRRHWSWAIWSAAFLAVENVEMKVRGKSMVGRLWSCEGRDGNSRKGLADDGDEEGWSATAARRAVGRLRRGGLVGDCDEEDWSATTTRRAVRRT